MQTAIMKDAFHRVGVGGTGDEFMEPRGRSPEKVWKPLGYCQTETSSELSSGMYCHVKYSTSQKTILNIILAAVRT
jgi:hypothetical protein